MRNPYEVLEIREGASEEEIRSAYKNLVRKYHPDQYANNPLSDLAEEKLKEINEAYDFLMKNKGRSHQSNQGNNWNNQQYNNTNDIYAQVRRMIERGNIIEADQALDRVTNRTAEWNYLKGIVFLRKGWYDQAYQFIQMAVNMDPGNYEYRSALNNLAYRNRSYRNVGNARGYRGDTSFCDVCQCLICSDCCCECMGGDLIDCC